MPKGVVQNEVAAKAEAARLRELMPRIRRRSGFGDDNWAAIKAALAVLEKRLTLDDVYERWGDDDQAYVMDAALQACEWLWGTDDEESPVESWEPLAEPD